MGRALQLTNILRDVCEDAELGRLYLPDELLAAYGITGDDPRQIIKHPALSLVCRDVAVIARRHYAEASTAMAACPRQTVLPAAIMKRVYRRILDRLEASEWVISGPRIHLSTAEKLWCLLRGWLE